jgi:DNA-binding IscR family transcriptional regulator
VRQHPGITIADLAKRMSIQPNYLYRVLPQLQQDGKVRKRGKEWHPA